MNIPNKFCHHCGKQTQPAAKFCGNCGTSLASIDEKPPVAEPKIPNTRIQPRAQASFRPVAVGADGEEDYDDEGIRADRVNSIHELGISISSLDIDLRTDFRQRETVAGLMTQGSQMAPSPEEKRIVPQAPDQATILQQFAQEGGTLRKG